MKISSLSKLSCAALPVFFIVLISCSREITTDITVEDISIAESIVSTALEDERGYDLLRELKEFGPRLSGSENSLNAIYWAEKKMKEMGLDKVKLQPVMVPHWERGDMEEAVLFPDGINKGERLSIGALGGSIATPRQGITAEVIEVKSFEELNTLGSKVGGKIVFYNYYMKKGFKNSFEAYGDAVRFRSRGAIEAARHGAVAAIVRSVTTKHDNVPHLGAMGYEEDVEKIPAVAIGHLDGDLLSNALSENPALKIRLKLSCRTLPDAQSYNVIGELTGSEKPEEVIVVGGHFDSWDAGDGSHDDGGPCIQTLEVLDLFKRLGIKPKRTVRCVFFINEENGTMGGRVYGDYAAESDEKHIAAIESDRGLLSPRGFSVTSSDRTLASLRKWLPAFQKAGIEWVNPGGGGVDISFIRNAKAQIGYVPDDSRYFDFHHSANDVFESVHPREMEFGTAAIAILTYLLSEYGI